MRVLIDTNILISAALSSKGTPYQAFIKAVTYPNHGMVCEQNIDELRRIFNRKFPQKIHALETFLSLALMTLELVPTPVEEHISESKIRDVNDRPILRAAIDGVRFEMVTTETLFTRTSETTDSENNQIKAVYEKLPRKFHLYVNGEEVPLDGETQEN